MPPVAAVARIAGVPPVGLVSPDVDDAAMFALLHARPKAANATPQKGRPDVCLSISSK
jgi:hypothetical protein